MELYSIDNLSDILRKYHFDQIYCGEEFFKLITYELFFITDGEITLDGWNDTKMGYILFDKRSIEIHLDFNMKSIILKYSTVKKERLDKLNGINNSSN
jgi:hypothetical protein